MQILEAFIEKELPKYEKLVPEEGFLSEECEPGIIDAYVAPYFEQLYLLKRGPMEGVFKCLNIKKNAPKLLAYIRRFRQHELIHDYKMQQDIFISYLDRSCEMIGRKNDYSLDDYIGVLG